MPADGCMHLDRQSRLSCPFHRLDRSRPCSGQSAKCVVDLRRRTVQRNSQSHYPSFLHLEDRFSRQQRSGARRYRDLHTLLRRIANQLIQIGPLQRIAAGKHKNRNMHIRDLVDQRLAFRCRQLVGMRNRLCRRPAVLASQIARLRDFPDRQKRRLVVIQSTSGRYVMHWLLLHKTSNLLGAENALLRIQKSTFEIGQSVIQITRFVGISFRKRLLGWTNFCYKYRIQVNKVILPCRTFARWVEDQETALRVNPRVI